MRPRRSPWVIAGAAVGLVIVVNLALRELDKYTRSPGGPESSSYATAPEGTAAYAELLRHFERPVLQLRDDLGAASLDPRTTLMLLEPSAPITADDGRAVQRFVEAGGRLVAGGQPKGWLGNIVSQPPAWRFVPPADAQAHDLPGVATVRTADGGAWVDPRGHVVLRADGKPIAVERHEGAGTIILLADASPLQNRLLASADNAAFGLALAGERPVVFAESVHGYGTATGVGAIPRRWWWLFGGLALASFLFALARGRRLGPPELPERDLPPARVEFAEALATQLAKSRPQREAVRTARRIARARVASVLSLPAEAKDADLRRSAEERGFDAAAVEAVVGDGTGQADLLALGRALRSAHEEEAFV
jgi:hypothetical protein